MMTLQQQAMRVMERLSDEQLSIVIQFAEFLSLKSEPANEDGYIRKPGILKRKMAMADDFDETPECFKEYI
ncbi:MAG: DUF2281 domain-containing protein [Firmicutes bacterium]|nr:DUF2281 domain-containing protein [Bacillota bacterium]